jgi:hypothetical protein
MIKLIQTNEQIKQRLNGLLSNITDDIVDFQFNVEEKVLLFPTNDVTMTQKQFNAFLETAKIIGGEFIYTEVGWHGKPFGSDSKIFKLQLPFTYEDYSNICMNTTILLFSIKSDLILVIEESQEGGTGILGGSKEIINIFKTFYYEWKEDRKKIYEFYLKENAKRNVPLGTVEKLLKNITE